MKGTSVMKEIININDYADQMACEGEVIVLDY